MSYTCSPPRRLTIRTVADNGRAFRKWKWVQKHSWGIAMQMTNRKDSPAVMAGGFRIEVPTGDDDD